MAGNRAHLLPVHPARSRSALAVAVAVLAAVIVPFFSRPAAAAPTYRHVAIVVAGIGASCVPWHSGLTGADLVDKAAKTVYKNDRLVQIGNRPSSATKYPKGRWFFYTVVSDAWAHSTTSAAETTLRAGSVSGWTYSTSGKATAPKDDAADTYELLCGALDRSSSKNAGGNGVTVNLTPGKAGKTYRSGAVAKPSAPAKSGTAKKPKASNSPKSSKSTKPKRTSGQKSGSSATASGAPATGTALASDDPSSGASTKSKGARGSRTATDASASPVADQKSDAAGPGLGLATAGLLVFIVLGGIGLYVVRRRLLGDDSA